MAIIYSYPQAIPKDSDLIIGTVTYDPNDPSPVRGNPTRSFRVSDLAASITGNSYTLTSKALGANSSIVLTDNTGFIAGTVNFNSGAGVSALNSGNTITITNTGVLSNIAGTGISLSGTTGNVTITNSGVTGMAITDTTFVDLSLTSSTGDVTLTAALSATGTPTNLNFLRGDNVWATPAGGGTVTSVNSGTGISVDNTDPDNPIINNSAPDQTVVLTGSGGITITGTYPSFNVDSVPGGVITVTAGTNISITGTASDPIINNTAPDQVVTISGAGATSVAGSYPNFTVSSPAIPDLSNYVQGSGTSGQLTMWDSSGNAIEDAPIDIKANGDINIGALTNSQGSGFTSLIHTLRMYNRLYVGSTGGSGSNGDVLISTGATTDAQDGLDWSPVADYLKRQTTDISTFNSVDDDVTLGGGSASNTLLASQLAIKTYVDNTAAGSGSLIYQGGYDASTNTPDLTSSPNSIMTGWTYAVTVAGDASGFWVPTLGVGDLVIANVDNPTSVSDWTEVQSNIDVATAGTSATAVRGIAGFNEDDFTAVNGFVSVKDDTYVPYTGATTDVDLGANKAIFGTNSDLKIYHTGSASIIEDVGQGDLVIKGTDLYLRNAANSNRLYAGTDVRLYYNGAEKIRTTSTGASVTGNLIVDTNTLYVDSTTNNVGIGTTSPSAKLHVKTTNTTAEDVAYFGNNNITDGLAVTTNGNLDWGFNARNGRNLTFSTNQIERMRITSAGNLGLGTASPSAKLHVYNPNGGDATSKASMLSEAVLKLQPHAANSTNLLFAQVNGGDGIGLQVTNGSATANWDLALSPFGGNVGIGTANPSVKLEITAPNSNTFLSNITSTTSANIHQIKNDNSKGIETVIYSSAYSGGTYLNVGANGSVINGNSKTAITTVGAFDLLLGTNSTERMRITSAGGVSFGSSGTAYGSSGQVLTSNGNTTPTWQDAAGLPIKTVDTVASIPNATTATFTLSVTPSSENYVDLYISGVYQSKTAYTVSGTTLTLDGGVFFPQGALVETVTTT